MLLLLLVLGLVGVIVLLSSVSRASSCAERTEGMSSIIKLYVVDGRDHYRIEYRRERDGTFSIWCHEHPHNPFGGAVQDHHLYSGGRVCVSAGKEPTSLDRAKAIAHVFMRSFSHWCRSGTPGRTGGRVNV